MPTYYDENGKPYVSDRPSGPNQTERVSGVPDDIFYDPLTGAYYDVTPGWTSTNVSTQTSSGGGSGSYGGGSGSIDYTDSAARQAVAREYDLWMGDGWAAAHPDVVSYAYERRWGVDDIMSDAVGRGANSAYANGVWQYIRSKCGDISASQVQAIMQSGVWKDTTRFEQYVAPQYSGSSILTNRQSDSFVRLWEDYTAGKPMTWTAEQKLQEIANTYGFTPEGQAAWENWLTTTQSANAGNYGAQKRSVVRSVFMDIMHREPTAEELAQGSEWMDLITGPMGSLNTAAFAERLRATPEYQEMYKYKPGYMSEAEWWQNKAAFDSVGNWYFNDTPFTGPGFQYTDEEIGQLINEGWTPSGLQNYYTAVELSVTNKAVYDPILQEAFGAGFSDDEWFTLSNGGQGSGALKAKLIQAQGRVEFREAYRQVFGSDPGPADYDRITNQFVSPSELIREYQAINSAAEMYPEVSDLLQRVYGMSVTEDDLKDMALGRAGTGDLRALINEAQKLDSYRWIHKQYYGAEPTPADYAKYAGYAGPDELQWEIVTQERIGEYSDVIKEDFKIGLGLDIADDDIFTMLGEQEGYGELRAEWTKAKKKRKDVEEGEKGAHRGEKVNIAYQEDPLGGFRTALPGLANL